jgi:hypothetical protein
VEVGEQLSVRKMRGDAMRRVQRDAGLADAPLAAYRDDRNRDPRLVTRRREEVPASFLYLVLPAGEIRAVSGE